MLSHSILRRKAFQLKAKTSIISNINPTTWITSHDTISIRQALSFSSSFSSRPSKFTNAFILHLKVDISRVKFNFMKNGIIGSQYRNETTIEHNHNNSGQIASKVTRRSRVTSVIEERRRKQQKFCDEHFNKDHISLELLEDFPAWLDNFGLKYLAPYFKDKKWQDIIEMNSEDLNNLGIRTQKIQNFLLINFWYVRDYIASQKGTKLQPSKQLEMLLNRKEFYENNYDKTINYELLENFPMWLEGLGLKHLARYFEGKRWEEIIEMDWQALDVLGIESRLIRGKLVSHFWKVKRDIAAKKGITLPGKGESRKRELTVEEKEIIAQREKLYKDNYIININYKLLEDFPAWLDGLDLKYHSSLFEGKTWNEIIDMDSQSLKAIGVNSFTPREKLLTCFWFAKRDLAIKHGTKVPSIELVRHRRFFKDRLAAGTIPPEMVAEIQDKRGHIIR